jgi:hypothetical protein
MLRVDDRQLSGHSARVSDAVRMVRDQADCSIEEAFVLMHERATMSGVTMEEIIDAVVKGNVRFEVGM